MISKEKYVVFREDDIDIMFDKKSGAFAEVSSDEKDYDLVYEKTFKKQYKLKDSYACEGPRLGRLSFLTTQYCNLQCKYCFANSGTYNSKGEKVMSAEIMRKAFEFMCGEYKDGINLVHFFGGEPMLGFKSIEEFVPWCYEFCRDKNLVPPVFSIVSNGTIMNKKMLEFLERYKVNIVVSIDGNKELNDLTRVSTVIPSVYDVIKKNFTALPTMRNFKVGCEMTINKNHIKAYREGIVKEWLDDIRQIGFDYATVGIAETPKEDCKITEEEKNVLESIERETIDYFFDRLLKNESFKSVEIVNLIKQISSHKQALSCGAGYHSLTVTADGSILPCYQFYHDDRFNMGTLDKVDKKKFNRIREIFKDTEGTMAEECLSCWLRGSCTVRCKGFSYNTYGVLNHIAESRCWMLSAATRRILMHIVKMHKEREKYDLFIQKLYEFNKSYTYNH